MTRAILALWNGIDQADSRAEYEDWHALEHVPERVALPGFLWGRRYRGGQDGGRYFTVYGLQGLEALETVQYADVIENPTPWSARMRPRLSEFVRRPCVKLASAGVSFGAHIVTVRATTRHLAQWSAAATEVVAQVGLEGRVVRCVAAVVPPTLALAYPVGGERIPKSDADQITVVLLVEHCTEAGARAAADGVLAPLSPLTEAGAVVEHFTLQSHVARINLPSNMQGRPPARLEAMQRYLSIQPV